MTMIGAIAVLRTREGAGAEFEAVFAKLAAAVRAGEPGNLVYQLTRSRTEPGVYKVLEVYQDDEAVAAHRASPHYRELGAALGPFLAGRAEVEVLDAI
jgi:quinol monooxygenase YgiN